MQRNGERDKQDFNIKDTTGLARSRKSPALPILHSCTGLGKQPILQ